METKTFYYLCLIGITFLGGCFLLLLRKNVKFKEESKGVFFLALGLFSFATIGLYKLFDPPVPELLLSEIDRIFSVFTNIFFVTALPFFTKAFVNFRSKVPLFCKTDQWVISVFIFFTFLAALFSVIERNIDSELGQNVIVGIDSIFSTITIGLATYGLYKSTSEILNGKFARIFNAVLISLFPLSQVLLPLTHIFPSQFGHFYFPSLIILLLGLMVFAFNGILYLSYQVAASGLPLSAVEETSSSDPVNEIEITGLSIGFDSTKKVYFIELEFLKNGKVSKERCDNKKILQPYANWVLFSVAKKVNVKLINQDIALAKFRMIEYWNKNADTKLNQDVLFTNDSGFFEFNFLKDRVEIIGMNELKSKYRITENLQKNIDNFAQLNIDNEEKVTPEKILEMAMDSSHSNT